MFPLPAPYAVRLMQMTDIPAVIEIERAVQSSPWLPSSFEVEILQNDQSVPLVLTAEHQIVAYNVYWIVAGELQIHNIATAPAWRGLGLGAALLIASLVDGFERHVEVATLEVRRSNVAAQTLYKRYGFDMVGVRRAYYRDNKEDAFLMTAMPFDDVYRQQLLRAAEQLCLRLGTRTL